MGWAVGPEEPRRPAWPRPNFSQTSGLRLRLGAQQIGRPEHAQSWPNSPIGHKQPWQSRNHGPSVTGLRALLFLAGRPPTPGTLWVLEFQGRSPGMPWGCYEQYGPQGNYCTDSRDCTDSSVGMLRTVWTPGTIRTPGTQSRGRSLHSPRTASAASSGTRPLHAGHDSWWESYSSPRCITWKGWPRAASR